MTEGAFEALVSRLEVEARQSPRRYQWKVVGLALLGNAYLVGVLLVLLALVAAMAASVAMPRALAIKLMLVVGVLLVVAVRAMWVKLDPPSGTLLNANESPELFALIDKLRTAMHAPRFHRVQLTDDFNASVMQVPRLGVLGWPRNYLLIGLPLLKAMKAQQFEAVLAHEMAHLAHGHGRLANWVYSQRQRWSKLAAALEQRQSRGAWLFLPFLRRFAPYFNAYSFPLARANEYEADATAASITSKAAMADALTSVAVVGSYLSERYWRDIVRHADEQPMPSFAPHAAMGRAFHQDLDPLTIRGYLQRALDARTGHADTHPALHDRLAAIGAKACLHLPKEGRGADRLLGAALPRLVQAFDERWQASITPAWTERFNAVRAGRECLAALDARVHAGDALTRDEAFERAQLTADITHDDDAAIEQLRVLQAADPQDVAVCFALGMRLLAQDDDEGLTCLTRAIALDEFASTHALECIRDFHLRHGRDDDARAADAQLVQRVALESRARDERSRMLLTDRLVEHDLPAEDVQALRRQLEGETTVRSVYIARKHIDHLAHRACYVVAFTVTPWWRGRDPKRVEAALKALQERLTFPGETILVCIEGEYAGFRRALRKLSNTKLV